MLNAAWQAIAVKWLSITQQFSLILILLVFLAGKMAFKYICVVVLLSVAILSAQGRKCKYMYGSL